MSREPTAVVVEDDPSLLRLFSAQLKHIGYQVVSLDNAADALHFLKSGNEVTLLLTDVVLPGNMNGPQLSEAYRSRSPQTATLYTSGYPAGILDRMGIANVDASKLIQKPFRLRDLKAAIARLSQRGGGTAEPRQSPTASKGIVNDALIQRSAAQAILP